jgi:hypothetical protein
MELDKFLEQDIMKFLDIEVQMRKSHISRLREDEFQIFDLNRDYSKEVAQALEMDNVAKAQRTLKEVKDIYNKLAENTEAKKKAYSILEELYKKTKEYVDAQKGSADLAEEISTLESSGFFEGAMPEKIMAQAKTPILRPKSLAEQPVININIYGDIDKGKEKPFFSEEKKLEGESDYLRRKVKEEIANLGQLLHPEKTAPPAEQEQKTQKEREEEEKTIKYRRQMNNSLELLYGALKNKDLTRAKNEYLNMKKLLDAFPFKNEEEKEEVLTDFISLRDQIKELESYLEEKAQKKKEEMRTEAERGIEQRKEQEISTIINQAEKLAKQKDFHKANFFYLNAKHKLEKIQEEETRMLLSDRLEKLKQKIMIEKISEKVEEQVVPLKKEISLLEKTRKKKELPEQSSEIYKNGLRELYAGKKEEAAKLFRKVLEINPNYVAAKIRLKEALGEA